LLPSTRGTKPGVIENQSSVGAAGKRGGSKTQAGGLTGQKPRKSNRWGRKPRKNQKINIHAGVGAGEFGGTGGLQLSRAKPTETVSGSGGHSKTDGKKEQGILRDGSGGGPGRCAE